jgi:actin-related protein
MNTIILDNGTGIIKAGLAGENFPRVILPNVVGYPKFKRMAFYSNKSIYICDNAISKKGILKLSYPLKHGIVQNWDELEKVWDKTFDMLGVNTCDYNMLLTEAPFNPLKNREQMSEIMFEKFNVPKLYIAIQAVLSLYAAGRTTGIVLDSGDGVTHTVPIYDGFIVNHCNLRTNLAGRNMTNYMGRLLMEQGLYLHNSSEREIVKKIKEKLCYLSLNYQKELKTNHKHEKYTLPDGQIIKIGQERFKCPEALFNPSLLRKEIPGIHELIKNTIDNCDITIRKNLYNNIILSGGTTTFKGFKDRLELELENLVNKNTTIKIINPLQRKYTVWIGGSILGSLETFSNYFVTKKEWEESGNSIIHKKFN